MTTRITTDWQIVEGPSREELFDALRLFKEQRTVGFKFRWTEGTRNRQAYLLARVTGISLEDGSGHSWRLKVWFETVPGQNVDVEGNSYSLFYNNHSRSGCVTEVTGYRLH